MSWSLRGVSFFPESGGVISSFQGRRSRSKQGCKGSMAWKIRFGGHNCLHGSEHFPQLRLNESAFVKQKDTWNCGVAVMLMLLEVCRSWANTIEIKIATRRDHCGEDEEESDSGIDHSSEDEVPSTFQPLPDYTVRYLKRRSPELLKDGDIREPKSMNLEIISKAFLQMPLPV